MKQGARMGVIEEFNFNMNIKRWILPPRLRSGRGGGGYHIMVFLLHN